MRDDCRPYMSDDCQCGRLPALLQQVKLYVRDSSDDRSVTAALQWQRR
jgi:hypothetical protein